MIQPELRFYQKNGEQFPEYEQVSLGDLYTERNEKGNSSLPILTISIHSGVSDGEADEDELGKRVNRSEDKSLCHPDCGCIHVISYAPGESAFVICGHFQSKKSIEYSSS